MNFVEAATAVVEATKRPEKIITIYRKLNSAISFYSLDNKFQRDFEEALLPTNAQLYKQPFALTLLPRFRHFRYIKKGGTKNFINPLTNADLFSKNDCPDRYYIAGDYFHIYSSSLIAGLDVGYYKHPPVLSIALNNQNYWMLDVAPWMIIDRAAAEIFRDIGDEKSLQSHMSSAKESYMAARKDLGIATE